MQACTVERALAGVAGADMVRVLITELLLVHLALAVASDKLPGMQLHRVLLPQVLADAAGAYCADGSVGGYYYLPAGSAANGSKLVVALEGGGECRTAADCVAWRGGSGPSSTSWPRFRSPNAFSELSSSADSNPDFHDWAKLFLPYCTADMHSGRRRTPDAALGGFHFAGHNLIVGSLQHLRNSSGVEPTTVLVTGSSAGGIGALLHADFFSRWWSRASVKVSPACGFFYAGVSSVTDWEGNRTTPAANLGFIDAWKPYIDEGCAAATGGDVAACTDAHFALPHLRTPLFLRENLYDTAKLANCGLDARGPLSTEQERYLRAWGGWMRSQLLALTAAASGPHASAHGFFAPSCLDHGENLDWSTAPPVGGVALRDAMSTWFFGRGAPPRLVDDCGELPCTLPAGGRCDHVLTDPLGACCQAELRALCPGLEGGGAECDACVRAHSRALIGHGCPKQGAPVFAWWCDGGARPRGHHVCDLAIAH